MGWHHYLIIEQLYLSAICWSELPLGRDIIRSEMVWRRRWKVWGRGWAASPAITMSERGCSQTPRSLSYRVHTVEVFIIGRCNNKAKVMLHGFLTFNHSVPAPQFLCFPCFHHLPRPQVQRVMGWEMLRNAKGCHAGRWSGSHCTAANWMPERGHQDKKNKSY